MEQGNRLGFPVVTKSEYLECVTNKFNDLLVPEISNAVVEKRSVGRPKIKPRLEEVLGKHLIPVSSTDEDVKGDFQIRDATHIWKTTLPVPELVHRGRLASYRRGIARFLFSTSRSHPQFTYQVNLLYGVLSQN
ncbi:hypothetical protein R1sor_027443 [Riccia sorocarpa]|uniref:Uncharacterized protein n=1 Tax=Riccia sorocarpa TaxID=122646 RepID=A0ABD3GHD4_9MARC